MKKLITSISLVVLTLIFCPTSDLGIQEAHAELPEMTRVNFRLFERINNRNSRRRLLLRVSSRLLDVSLETGETCTVELGACVQRFIPRGEAPNNDNRNCDITVVDTKTIGEGVKTIRFNMKSRPIAKSRRGKSRQVSFQTESTCTDGTETVVVESNPRAKKITSEEDSSGFTVEKFLNRLVATAN
ncbi:MAG: hypothetical protein R3A13_10255 [Bdellovibrionota bacterium]